MPDKKPVTHISGLIAGVLLFLALLAVQLNNVFFNGSFQQTAIDRLNLYGRIIASPDRSSSGSGDIPFETAVKISITPDLFNKNVKSLINGLIDYVSGRTNNLPDLYIAGTDKLSIAASAGITPATVEKINLQLVMMFSSEQNYNDILSVISLIQFILLYLPAFLILLFAAVVAAVLRRNSSEIIDWIYSAAFSYYILCWLTALLIGSTPWLIPFPGLSGLPESTITGVLSDYILYCSVSISRGILLSGLILPVGMVLALYSYRHLVERPDNVGPIDSASGCRLSPVLFLTPALIEARASFNKVRSIQFSRKALSALLSTAAVYSLLAFVLISNTYGLFEKRNLVNAVSYILGSISYNSYTDARNEDVCLLNLKVLQENDNMPVRDIQAAIYPLDVKAGGKAGREKYTEIEPEKTDKDGVASFLLSEGVFRLVLNASDLAGYEGQAVSDSLSYDLSLVTPGKTELTIILGSDAATAGSDPGTAGSNGTVGTIGIVDSDGTLGATVTTGAAESTSNTGKPDDPGDPRTSSLSVIPRLRIVEASMQYIP